MNKMVKLGLVAGGAVTLYFVFHKGSNIAVSNKQLRNLAENEVHDIYKDQCIDSLAKYAGQAGISMQEAYVRQIRSFVIRRRSKLDILQQYPMRSLQKMLLMQRRKHSRTSNLIQLR